MYHDRTQAGLVLARKLKQYKNQDALVLAIPRGGVPIGYTVAVELGLPLDIVLTKKIGHPFNKEYAIGAVSLADSFIIPHDDVSQSYIEHETNAVRQRLKEMYTSFKGLIPPERLEGRILIIVDDGIATGNTLMVTVRMLRKSNPAKIVIAVPVSSQQAFDMLAEIADEIICPLIPPYFGGVGAFYENFWQVSDEEVVDYLQKAADKQNHS